jgi:hypothetical protein
MNNAPRRLKAQTSLQQRRRRNHGNHKVDRWLARLRDPEQADRQHDSTYTTKQERASGTACLPPAATFALL